MGDHITRCFPLAKVSYFRGWFLVDFVSTLPLSYISYFGARRGSVASPRYASARPLHTRSTNTFGASVSEVAMRPDP